MLRKREMLREREREGDRGEHQGDIEKGELDRCEHQRDIKSTKNLASVMLYQSLTLRRYFTQIVMAYCHNLCLFIELQRIIFFCISEW